MSSINGAPHILSVYATGPSPQNPTDRKEVHTPLPNNTTGREAGRALAS